VHKISVIMATRDGRRRAGAIPRPETGRAAPENVGLFGSSMASIIRAYAM